MLDVLGRVPRNVAATVATLAIGVAVLGTSVAGAHAPHGWEALDSGVTSTTAPPPLRNGVSLFQNVGSGHCMSDNGSPGNNSQVFLVGCNSGTNNQLWYAFGGPAGGIMIGNNGAGRCLTNLDGFNASGNEQIIYDCSDGNFSQTYYAYANNSNGTEFDIETWTQSGNLSGYCLTSNGNNNVNAPLVIAPCNRSANQTFIAPVLE